MYSEVAPQPRLRSLVSRVWAFPMNEHVHRVLPDGCMDIVLLDNRAMLVGPMRSAVLIPAQAKATLGIRMCPGEADRLFPGMAGELRDSDAPLSDLWGSDGRLLADALLAVLERATAARYPAQTILREALPIVEKVITARLAFHRGAADVRMRAAAALLAEGTSVAQAAARVGLSERQLTRRFRARIGLGPKTFARVRRLQRAALLLQAGATPSIAAASAGYADQPHFTREASELAGISPGGLTAELTDGRDTIVPVRL
jgi:AraC-like DNA-binding protein